MKQKATITLDKQDAFLLRESMWSEAARLASMLESLRGGNTEEFKDYIDTTKEKYDNLQRLINLIGEKFDIPNLAEAIKKAEAEYTE